MHNLSHAVDVDASLARFEERSRHVQINEETLCDSCHSRLGTKLFAMYPDDSVVCYKVSVTGASPLRPLYLFFVTNISTYVLMVLEDSEYELKC